MTAPAIGYATALEQLEPREAVRLATLAEHHGFSGVIAADAAQPFTPTQGQAGFVWNIVSALGAHTTGELGVGALAPTYRWHPALVAQASATLESLYPGRHWLGLGSGEAISEHVVGSYWPEPAERINRMFEAVTIVKKLFSSAMSGRDVKHEGTWYRLESSRVWSSLAAPPPILIATAGPVTAKRAGQVADGLLIDSVPFDKMSALLHRFAEGARESGRDREHAVRHAVRIHLSWAPTDAAAMANALAEWPQAGMRFAKSDIRSPYDLEQIAKLVRAEDFDERMLISSDLDAHRANIQRYLDLGFSRLYLHNVGRNHDEFVQVFGREVLPRLVA
ncbi:MAG: TIGR03557 family F420-dependent LLM class oxidoreductase [Microcella sp.]|nr:MAG: TIGR03557 family F420-dependent LLM class oxidoreductase [Microcella sp.]